MQITDCDEGRKCSTKEKMKYKYRVLLYRNTLVCVSRGPSTVTGIVRQFEGPLFSSMYE